MCCLVNNVLKVLGPRGTGLVEAQVEDVDVDVAPFKSNQSLHSSQALTTDLQGNVAHLSGYLLPSLLYCML